MVRKTKDIRIKKISPFLLLTLKFNNRAAKKTIRKTSTKEKPPKNIPAVRIKKPFIESINSHANKNEIINILERCNNALYVPLYLALFICALISDIQFNYLILARKSTRLNSSHVAISYAVFCLKKQK